MKLRQKSKDQNVDINDFYALRVKVLWEGLKQEHISFWMLCIYFFFEYVRPQSVYPAIDVLPYSQIFLGLAIISAFADPSVKWVGGAGNKLMILYTMVIILSGLFAFKPMIAWDNKIFFLNWLLVYFLVVCVVNTEKRLFLFICAFLLFNLKMSQHGFISWAQRGFSFASWGLTGTPGWFRNSGEFALEMLIFTPLSAAFVIALRERWSRYKKWVMYFLPVSGVVSIVGASSRGGQLGLMVIGILLLLKSKHRIKAIAVLGIISLALYYLLPAEQIQRFSEIGDDATSLQRIAYWEYGLKLMNEYPMLGVGYFNWLDYLNYSEPAGIGPMQIIQLPHNIFIRAGAELGYTGLFVFVAMIAAVLFTNASTRKITKGKNSLLFYLAYGLDVGLIGFLVGGFFVSVLYYPFFWIQFALTMTVYSVAKREYEYVGKAIEGIAINKADSKI